VAQVAADEPETAAKMPQPITFTCVSLPGSHCTHGESPRNISSESLVRNRISPIQMNSGNAASVHDALALQVVVARTVPIGTLVVSAIATRPTRPRETAIHTPLASTTIMKASRINASSAIPGVANISRRLPD
jgi:hypothetical protein